MTPEQENLDTRFDLATQLLEIKDLRQGFGHLEGRLKEVGQLLILHRSRPAAVLLDFQAYLSLIKRLQEFEERLEEAELADRYRERLATEASEHQTEEAFMNALAPKPRQVKA